MLHKSGHALKQKCEMRSAQPTQSPMKPKLSRISRAARISLVPAPGIRLTTQGYPKMRSESEVPFEDQPFTIPVADRVKRLPPYMFGKINKLKYDKRVAGVDVIARSTHCE